jgi:hypothetical protein
LKRIISSKLKKPGYSWSMPFISGGWNRPEIPTADRMNMSLGQKFMGL